MKNMKIQHTIMDIGINTLVTVVTWEENGEHKYWSSVIPLNGIERKNVEERILMDVK